MREQDIIQRYFSRDGVAPGIEIGIGDDTAVVTPSPAARLAISTDTLVQGTHFPASMAPGDLGFRSLAVNLSDLAAMGATPRWCLLALSLPDADSDWLAQFSDGFFACADAFDTVLVGGDTVRGPLSVTVTVHGEIVDTRPLTRTGARAGDVICVTGTLGDASAGLGFVGEQRLTPQQRQLRERFCRPTARLRLGALLLDHATAAIDVSDGLSIDVERLCQSSGVGARVDVARLPLSAALTAELGVDGARHAALVGGDDYELCFTVPPDRLTTVERLDDACPVTAIGEVTADSAMMWLLDGAPFAIGAAEFRHFD